MSLCRRKDIGKQETPSIADDPGRTLQEWERSRENNIWDSVVSGLSYSGKMHSGKRRRPVVILALNVVKVIYQFWK